MAKLFSNPLKSFPSMFGNCVKKIVGSIKSMAAEHALRPDQKGQMILAKSRKAGNNRKMTPGRMWFVKNHQ